MCPRHHPLLLLVFAAASGWAQTSPSDPPQPSQPTQPAVDKRAYGVLPNNRTADSSVPFKAITAKEKLTIAAKDSFDGAVYPTAMVFSLVYQAENQNPSFGQGMKGYAKRVGGAFADQMIGNMMTEGFMPALLHEDPRYFRLGHGGGAHRALYALSRIIVTPNDQNHLTFNFAEWTGNSVATAISNVYYKDGRNWQDNLTKLLIQCGTDGLSNVLKEFWPDVKRRLSKKKTSAADNH